MSDKNTGGPAFPGKTRDGFRISPGMALRDYFAGQALVGLLAGGETIHNSLARLAGEEGVGTDDYTAGQVYAIADAMIAERQR